MADKVKNENFICIQGWMINDLKLKGNELIIYSIIFGFSQIENQVFNGGLQYLAEWTNSTKQGVLKNLKSLIDKGYIEKNEKYINGVKFCEYYTTKFNGVLNKVEQGGKQSLTGGVKQSLPNNINNNNINNNIKIIKDIVDYLNLKIGSNYKHTTKSTKDIIIARLNEGYTLEDFKTVIDKKYNEWINTEMEQYLRPITLFSNKFESYLNAPVKKGVNNGTNKKSNGSEFAEFS